jgi:5-methylthioadenosine/S-adenosylhomocysteine deaminase
MSESVDVLLMNGSVVTMDSNFTVYPNGAVAIRGRDIVAVGPADEIAARYTAREVVDCTGHAVIPGLINAHAHAPMSLLRGLVADVQLDVWLFGYMFPVEGRFVTPEFCYTGTLLTCAEMIRGGTTTFVDMYFYEEEVARAADQAGMRAICGETVMRLPTPDAASYDEGLERSQRFIEQWKDHDRIIPTIAPHAPYTCTDEIYQQAADLCRQYGVPLVTHIAETARENAESRAERGLSPVAYANSVGAFDVDCIAAHCVHVNDEDIAVIREKGVGVAPCPTSNLKLASGIAPYQRFIEADVNAGLGTDGAASNDDLDMWSEIHLAALLPKGTLGDPTVVPAQEALALATSRGAKAVHLDHIIGSLEVGKRADITIIGLGKLHSSPRYLYSADAIYSHLVYSAHSNDVRDVLVDGKFLLRDQELLTVNQSEVMAQAQAIASTIDAFLMEREENLLDKIIAIGGVQTNELFEVQVKARIDQATVDRIVAKINSGQFGISKVSERTQYDTYFLWNDTEKGRIRLREDHRTDAGARIDPKYTLTLMAPAERGEYASAFLLGRARYTARADQTLRFYREYFQPDHVVEIDKHRRRWRLIYKGVDFALNIDTMKNQEDSGPFLEIKSRTWSRKDVEVKVNLIDEIFAEFGIDDSALVKQEYVDM